ncbi:MAG: hypothetical protein EXR79_17210 [Myxococcales bacterium]|nr:hypothetical protein [Myxococcales bacterium]
MPATPDVTVCGPGTRQADSTCTAPTADAADTAQDVADDTVADTLPDAAQADVPDAPADDGDVVAPDDGWPSAPDACVPQCVGKACGDDGCGGSCGTCADPAKPFCEPLSGKCKAQCVPACLGKTCGDDGCGGSCGTCATGTDCSASGHCKPPGWTCDPAWYATGDTCDCGCGAPDPDCKDKALLVAGCGSLETCASDGTCVSLVPSAWTCAPATYAALDTCDCGCGVADPDCAFGSLPTTGCGQGDTCGPDGVCVACKPTCSGKACGADGCGGLCGQCGDPKKPVCAAGQCVDPCSPKPVACTYASCGDDGCGGTCGACAATQACQNGTCASTATANPFSCKGNCGSKAPSGCSCTTTCVAKGTCCGDYGSTCACTPKCAGKTCGADGCGGSCGKCGGDKPWCGADGNCTATCKPLCGSKKCGGDGCGGSCGSCGAGATCSTAGTCVPAAWQCDPLLYGDLAGCDCGCGAVDVDCEQKGVATLGCPKVTSACSAKGLCEVAFCSANAGCQNAWCTGTYQAGGGKFGGVCASPAANLGAPGSPCKIGAQCAAGVCLQGLCRQYCTGAGDCPPKQACVGLPVAYGGMAVAGFAAVCTSVPGSLAPCSKQADCAAGDQTCIALVEPKTLGPSYVCGYYPAAPEIGQSCAVKLCPGSQFCLQTATKLVCTSYCPGGDGDCPSGWTCSKQPLHGMGTKDPADDPQVSVCAPK